MKNVPIIVLNNELVENNPYEYQLKDKLTDIANPDGTYQKKQLYRCLIPDTKPTKLKNSGLIGLLSDAYSNHRAVAIAPHDLWILLVSEIARRVNSRPETFRKMFTDSYEKKELAVVSSSDTELPMDSIVDLLNNSVNFDARFLFPDFDTNTPLIEEYFMALFCDMSSSYYDYAMYRCGIRSVKLLGDYEYWYVLQSNYEVLACELLKYDVSLRVYFSEVIDIISEILATFSRDDEDNKEFWINIFTQKNSGSGGDLVIDGWIKNLFITKHPLAKLNNFTTSHATVKYKNKSTDKDFVAIYGGFDYNVDTEGFCSLEYSKHIFVLTDT